jgi:hypothetical protein
VVHPARLERATCGFEVPQSPISATHCIEGKYASSPYGYWVDKGSLIRPPSPPSAADSVQIPTWLLQGSYSFCRRINDWSPCDPASGSTLALHYCIRSNHQLAQKNFSNWLHNMSPRFGLAGMGFITGRQEHGKAQCITQTSIGGESWT